MLPGHLLTGGPKPPGGTGCKDPGDDCCYEGNLNEPGAGKGAVDAHWDDQTNTD